MRRLAAVALLGFALSATAQIVLEDGPPKPYVTAVNGAKIVDAGKQQSMEMVFRVRDGFHINSHTPTLEYLIRTELTLKADPGVVMGKVEYPAGHAYSFSFSPEEKLDVYSGVLRIVAPVTVKRAGNHKLTGELRYQACDNAACYPPQTIPIVVDITAK